VGPSPRQPIIFFQAWRFITPGLKDRERKYAVPFVFASLLFFLGGCAMAYFSFEHALQFLISVGGSSLEVRYNPNQYLSLIIMMMFFFGLAFEFPVVLVSMELAGAVRPVTLLKGWRWAIIAIASVSAIFTPSGDPLSMMLLMIPLIVFYFASIAVGKLAGK
jgi:sec-independent protein translocase protein TatC